MNADDYDPDEDQDDEGGGRRRPPPIGMFAIIACDLHSNPKICRAGRDGRDVFIFALCRNAARGRKGWFQASDLDAEYVGGMLRITTAEAERGLQQAIKAKLLRIDPDETVHIVGWDSSWSRNASPAEERRQRRQRQREEARREKEMEMQIESKKENQIQKENGARAAESKNKNKREPVTCAPRPVSDRSVTGHLEVPESEQEARADSDEVGATREGESHAERPRLRVVGPQGYAGGDRAAEQTRIARVILALHVEVYNRVRARLGSTVPTMQPMGEPAERALHKLLNATTTLAGAEDAMRHALKLREVEAIRTGKLTSLGASMWSDGAYAWTKTRELADVDGSRDHTKSPGRGRSIGAATARSDHPETTGLVNFGDAE